MPPTSALIFSPTKKGESDHKYTPLFPIRKGKPVLCDVSADDILYKVAFLL
jgi:hypothetical protein